MPYSRETSKIKIIETLNRLFAVYDHMVQKPPCWRANYPLEHPKQKNIKLSCFAFDAPVGSLLSSNAVFVPCDRKLQRAYCGLKFDELNHSHISEKSAQTLINYSNYGVSVPSPIEFEVRKV